MLLLPSAPSGTQLTDEQKQLLLDLHNRARSMVDPIATNMEEMVRWCAVMQWYSFTLFIVCKMKGRQNLHWVFPQNVHCKRPSTHIIQNCNCIQNAALVKQVIIYVTRFWKICLNVTLKYIELRNLVTIAKGLQDLLKYFQLFCGYLMWELQSVTIVILIGSFHS